MHPKFHINHSGVAKRTMTGEQTAMSRSWLSMLHSSCRSCRLCLLLVLAWFCLPAVCTENQAHASGSRGSHAIVRADKEEGSLNAAMGRFLAALRNRDVEEFLSLFSRKKAWHYIGTLTRPVQVERVTYSQLERDLRRKSGWYEALIDAGPDDCFRNHVVASEGRPWVLKGKMTFVPPDAGNDMSVFVRWRKEGERWVVDAIAEPSA